MQFEEGTVLEGKVTSITNFGAFVLLPGGKSGMVHISEVSKTYVKDIHDHLAEGDTVKVKVLRETPEGKINLSIKRVQEEAERPAFRRERGQEGQPVRPRRQGPPPMGQVAPRSADASFEDKLKTFMQESDKKISGSRHYENQRKGSRRRRG